MPYNKNNLPIWAINKIKRLSASCREQEDYLYKHTNDTIHEDQKHCNKTIPELIDICLDAMAKTRNRPTVTAFNDAATMRELTIDALNSDMKSLVCWADKIGNDEKRLEMYSDIMEYNIGHGITWENNKMVYIEAKSALVVLRRQPNDPNDINFRRVTTYLNIDEELNEDYPNAVTLHKNKDLVPYMMQTQAYKNAKTNAERQKLLSYVQHHGSGEKPKRLPPASPTGNRQVEVSDEIQGYLNERQAFDGIKRNTGEEPPPKRQVKCDITKENQNNTPCKTPYG